MHGSLDFEGFQGIVQRGITAKLQQHFRHIYNSIYSGYRHSFCSIFICFRGRQQTFACVS